MIEELDEGLVHQAKRAPREDGLTESERIALNLFWRKDVRVPILAQVFQCSKNTVYYSCLTGGAKSYPKGRNKAEEVNQLIDRLGVERAWSEYVTPDMVRAVNAANKAYVKRRAA